MSFFSVSMSLSPEKLLFRNAYYGRHHYQRRGLLGNLLDVFASRSGRNYYYDSYADPYPRHTPPPPPAHTASGAALCRQCGSPIPHGSKFCLHCGAKVSDALFCPNCGENMPPNARFCQKCGVKISGQ